MTTIQKTQNLGSKRKCCAHNANKYSYLAGVPEISDTHAKEQN